MNDRTPAPVAGGVTACSARDRRRAAYRDRVDGGDCDVRVLRGVPHGLGEPLYADIGFKTNVIIAGGLAILMAIAFDALLVVAGRFVSPRKARPA